MESRKNLYTKKVIIESLTSLLKEKSLPKITVTDLCNLADINRSTFYRYYEDVYDVIQKSEEILYNNIWKANNPFLHQLESINSTSSVIIRNSLNAILKYKDLYHLLMLSNQSTLQTRLMNDTKEYLDKEYSLLDGVTYRYASYAYSYMINGCISIMHDWIKNNCNEPLEVIENVIFELIDSTCYVIWHPKNYISSNKMK